jgi:hypothetical protein
MNSAIFAGGGGSDSRRSRLFRKPRRITVTLSQRTIDQLVQRSAREGRSLANLAAVLLEQTIKAEQIQPPQQSSQAGQLSRHSQHGCHG